LAGQETILTYNLSAIARSPLSGSIKVVVVTPTLSIGGLSPFRGLGRVPNAMQINHLLTWVSSGLICRHDMKRSIGFSTSAADVLLFNLGALLQERADGIGEILRRSAKGKRR
jgi:hypothetical protein